MHQTTLNFDLMENLAAAQSQSSGPSGAQRRNLWDYLRASISCWCNRKPARQEERSPRSIPHSQLTIPTFQHQRGRAAVENNRNKCEDGSSDAVMIQKRCIQITNHIIDRIKGKQKKIKLQAFFFRHSLFLRGHCFCYLFMWVSFIERTIH